MQLEMAAGWSPRRTRVAGLLAVSVGLPLLVVLPAQYETPPYHLRLSLQASFLYASTVAGPLLLTWGVYAFRRGTPRPLTTRRLSLALALSIAVLAICHWRMSVLATDLVGGISPPGPRFVRGHPYIPVADPLSSPLSFVIELWGPSAIGPAAVAFSIVATRLVEGYRRRALLLGLLATTVVLGLGFDVVHDVGARLVLPLFLGFALLPFVFGVRLTEGTAPNRENRTATREPPDGRERPAVDVPAREPKHETALPRTMEADESRASLGGFVAGVILFGLYPAREFDLLWSYVDWLPTPLLVVSSLVGVAFVAWALASAWTGRLVWRPALAR